MKNIYEGRTKEDAIREACKELGVEKEELLVEVLEDEEPKKTMFSILDRKRVKIKVKVNKKTSKKSETKKTKSNNKTRIKEAVNINDQIVFLEKVLEEFKELYKEDNFTYEIKEDNRHINVTIDLNNRSKWIGYRGKTLNALQSVLTAMLASNFNTFTRAYINIGTYKEERQKQLESLASKISNTVKRTEKKITLEPMSSYERKIIHDYIAKDDDLKSESIGEEPNRKVVVSLK